MTGQRHCAEAELITGGKTIHINSKGEIAHVVVSDIRKTYRDRNGNPFLVLDGISLKIGHGEFVAIIGPNGCGKTTCLNIVAGIDKADAGQVLIRGQSPSEVRTGFMFQNYRESLFPWRTVVDNVAFPLEMRGVAKETRRHKAAEFLKLSGLDIPLDGFLYQLSGGQQQIVALTRALVMEPDIMIMDEPFSALDYHIRLQMHDVVQRLFERAKPTVLFVSHEVEEAVYLADRVIILSSRPAHVIAQYEVSLPRPRNRDLLTTPEFFEIRNRVLKAFHDALSDEEVQKK